MPVERQATHAAGKRDREAGHGAGGEVRQVGDSTCGPGRDESYLVQAEKREASSVSTSDMLLDSKGPAKFCVSFELIEEKRGRKPSKT